MTLAVGLSSQSRPWPWGPTGVSARLSCRRFPGQGLLAPSARASGVGTGMFETLSRALGGLWQHPRPSVRGDRKPLPLSACGSLGQKVRRTALSGMWGGRGGDCGTNGAGPLLFGSESVGSQPCPRGRGPQALHNTKAAPTPETWEALDFKHCNGKLLEAFENWTQFFFPPQAFSPRPSFRIFALSWHRAKSPKIPAGEAGSWPKAEEGSFILKLAHLMSAWKSPQIPRSELIWERKRLEIKVVQDLGKTPPLPHTHTRIGTQFWPPPGKWRSWSRAGAGKERRSSGKRGGFFRLGEEDAGGALLGQECQEGSPP